jgi:hypothetical protein
MKTFKEFRESVQSDMLSRFKSKHPNAKEQRIELIKLKTKIEGWIKNNYNMNQQDKIKVDMYSNMDPKTSPPILLQDYGDDDLTVIDGWHRLAAAYLRKDKTINALVAE